MKSVNSKTSYIINPERDRKLRNNWRPIFWYSDLIDSKSERSWSAFSF